MTRIKMFVFMPKRADVTDRTFHDHWRHPHGTWGRRIPMLQAYVQSHRIAGLPGPAPAYEGIVEVWIDGLADARALPDDPTYRRYLVPDEPNFIDMDRIRFLFMREEIIRSGPDPIEIAGSADFAWRADAPSLSIKLIQLIDPAPAPRQSSEEAALGDALGAFRHVVSQPVPEMPCAGTPFIRELWWPTLSEFKDRTARSPAALAAMIGQAPETTLLCQAERMI